MKKFSKKTINLFHEWARFADEDLQMAQLALTEDGPPNQICFHAQQAAEKALKAVLLFKKIEFPLVHDIEELLELAREGGVAVPPEIDEAGSLTPYAVEARYPGHLEEMASPDVNEAVRLAEAVLQWAAEILGSRKP